MRYSSALVLSTLAVGQAAAANIRHAGFHARRSAEQKRDVDYKDVDWNGVSYDLSHVDWSSVFGPTPTPTPSKAAPEPSKAEVKVEAAAPTSAYVPPAAKTTEAAEPSHTKSSGIGGLIGDISKLADGVGSMLKKAGISVPDTSSMVPTSPSSPIWVSESASKWQTTFINDASEDIVVICWIRVDKSDYLSMTVGSHAPILSMKLPSGSQQTVNFQDKASGACAPVFPDTGINHAGQLQQTWWEFTFPGGKTDKGEDNIWGTFDVSHEVYNKGRPIASKGSQCISDATQCSFQCKDRNAEFCGTKDSYELINCGSSSGGGGGWDANMGGIGGGCMMGGHSEHVKVTFQ